MAAYLHVLNTKKMEQHKFEKSWTFCWRNNVPFKMKQYLAASELHRRYYKVCLSAYGNQMHVTWVLQIKWNYRFRLPNS